jgi:hypothetical protein
LRHHVWPDGVVGRADFHVDLSILEVADRVDLVAAPGIHVGCRLGNARVHVVHARVVLYIMSA